MLNGQKKVKPRNYVFDAMVRAGKKSVAHGKTKKAERKLANQSLYKECASWVV